MKFYKEKKSKELRKNYKSIKKIGLFLKKLNIRSFLTNS